MHKSYIKIHICATSCPCVESFTSASEAGCTNPNSKHFQKSEQVVNDNTNFRFKPTILPKWAGNTNKCSLQTNNISHLDHLQFSFNRPAARSFASHTFPNQNPLKLIRHHSSHCYTDYKYTICFCAIHIAKSKSLRSSP